MLHTVTFPSNQHCSDLAVPSLLRPLSQAPRLETQSWMGPISASLEIVSSVCSLLSLRAAKQSSSGWGPQYSLFSVNSCTVSWPQSASQLTRYKFVQLLEVLGVHTPFSCLIWDFFPPPSPQPRSARPLVRAHPTLEGKDGTGNNTG